MEEVVSVSPNGEHYLNTGWSIWEHREEKKGSAASNYGASMFKMCSFDTIEEFWRYFNNIPSPSEIFQTGGAKKRLQDRTINGFSLFKTGIKPAWEDKANRAGGEWFCRKHLDVRQLDEYWLHMVLGAIGETIDAGDEVTGVRVVNKSSNKGALFRLELWYRSNEGDIANKLKANLIKCLGGANCGGQVPDFSMRRHD